MARIADLTGELDSIVAGMAAANADDEHDPEGATIAFERAQTSALLAEARRTVDEVDQAGRRLDAGTYGACETCHEPIAAERLRARPTSRTCMRCAERHRR